MRTYLSIPADSQNLDERALEADALILDAAGSPVNIGALRARAPHADIHVRVGEVDGPDVEDDLAAAMPTAPTGLVFRATSGRDVEHLAARLAVHEALCGLPDGATRIVVAIARAAGAIDAPSFRHASPRLSGLTWDPCALARELGVERAAEPGGWASPLMLVRDTVRLTAAAAGIEAIEAAFPGEEADLIPFLGKARRDGFGAIVLADPAHLALVHRAGGSEPVAACR